MKKKAALTYIGIWLGGGEGGSWQEGLPLPLDKCLSSGPIFSEIVTFLYL